MAASSSSLLLSPLSSATAVDHRELSSGYAVSAFTHNLLLAARPRKRAFRRWGGFKSLVARNSLDHIPKQFREENLKDGLMDNFKDAQKCLYGLTPTQMDLFRTEDNPFIRQSEQVTEESITSKWSYMNSSGMWSMSGKDGRSPSRFSMSYRGGRASGRRPRRPPPDLPSLLLDARIVYLGMPIVPAVCELLVAEFLWLDYSDKTKPIYLYINSPGTQNANREIVGNDSDAYVIADCMALCKAEVYTINIGMAYGQAAMLMSLGAKGKRGLQPNSCTKLYLPKMNRAGGSVSDTWIKAKELDVAVQHYIELLAKGTGKPEEEIKEDIQASKFLHPQAAIDYGVADKILTTDDFTFDREKMNEKLARKQAKLAAAAGGQLPRGP